MDSRDSAVFNVEVHGDTICPWCYIATRYLWEAIELFPNASFKFVWKPYMIAPEVGRDGQSMQDFMEKRYGKAVDLDDPKNILVKAISAAGVQSNSNPEGNTKLLSKMLWNSAASHRLIELSRDYESDSLGLKQIAIIKKIFDAFFKHDLNISDPKVLQKIAVSEGIRIKKNNIKDIDSSKFVTVPKVGEHGDVIKEVPLIHISRVGYPGSFKLIGVQPVTVLKRAFQSLLIPREEIYDILRKKSLMPVKLPSLRKLCAEQINDTDKKLPSINIDSPDCMRRILIEKRKHSPSIGLLRSPLPSLTLMNRHGANFTKEDICNRYIHKYSEDSYQQHNANVLSMSPHTAIPSPLSELSNSSLPNQSDEAGISSLSDDNSREAACSTELPKEKPRKRMRGVALGYSCMLNEPSCCQPEKAYEVALSRSGDF